jgi:DNA-directed RNA polymerase subunit RPC12/RpoP
MNMARKETPDATGAPSKSVLFCPECSFRSGLSGGAWDVSSTGGTTTYNCPECQHSFRVPTRR